MQLRTFTPRSKEHTELKGLSNLLDMLKVQHVQLNNQLHSAQNTAVKTVICKLVKDLGGEIVKVERKMRTVIKKHPSLNKSMDLMTSIKGVGQQTAYKILAHAPDMSCFANAKQFAAFIGISPRQHQSGKFIGKATISRIGNARLRKVFYMAALVAKRFNQSLQPFVKRLEMKGKPPKLIVCAIMRKLAHLVFGVMKNQRPFDSNFMG